MFRGYECFFCFQKKDGTLSQCGNSACWSSIAVLTGTLSCKRNDNFNNNIYIFNYDIPETRKYQELLIGTINQITPCAITKKDGRNFIKYTILETYDQNLILLNFIRNLWHEPHKGYVARFFENLILSGLEQKDPLARLTWANKQACPQHLVYPPGHSNVYMHKTLRVKEAVALIKYKGYNTYSFLTSRG